MEKFEVIFHENKKDHHGLEVYSFEAKSERHKLCTFDFTVSTAKDGMRLVSASKDFHNYLSRSEQEEIVAEARKQILASEK